MALYADASYFLIYQRVAGAVAAVARTVGWIAQWTEMIEDPSQKIGRPRQLYVGAGKREYVPLHKR